MFEMRILTLILFEVCFVAWASAMYFDLGEQEEKCIIEEIPEDTLVTGQELFNSFVNLIP